MKKNIRLNCLCCNNSRLKEALNLKKHSFADRFIPENLKKFKDPTYPLILDMCPKCKFFQLRHVTNPTARYNEVKYSYTSANSKFATDHWNKYYNEASKKIYLNSKKVLEIGSNDGYLSKIFKNNNFSPVCVDASGFMTKIAKKKGLVSENLLFNFKNSVYLKKKYGIQDVILANNVFNHSNNPKDFLKGVKNISSNKSIFIFEQPYFSKSIMDGKFDQIYHEHVSYFTVLNIFNLLKKSGFKIISLSFNNYHGGSIRTYAALKNNYSKNYDIKKYIKNENKKGIYNIKFFKKFLKEIKLNKFKIKRKILNYKNNGFKIIGVGAAAKANTILTFYDLNNKLIDFITDGSKFKINKYTPLTRLKIKKDNELKKYNKVLCIVLAWNINNLLKKKLLKINKNIKFIKIK